MCSDTKYTNESPYAQKRYLLWPISDQHRDSLTKHESGSLKALTLGARSVLVYKLKSNLHCLVSVCVSKQQHVKPSIYGNISNISHQSSHSSCCCGDSGDDLASDAFGLESVSGLDGVHPGPESRCRCDKVHVAVAVVVLLKLQWTHL